MSNPPQIARRKSDGYLFKFYESNVPEHVSHELHPWDYAEQYKNSHAVVRFKGELPAEFEWVSETRSQLILAALKRASEFAKKIKDEIHFVIVAGNVGTNEVGEERWNAAVDGNNINVASDLTLALQGVLATTYRNIKRYPDWYDGATATPKDDSYERKLEWAVATLLHEVPEDEIEGMTGLPKEVCKLLHDVRCSVICRKGRTAFNSPKVSQTEEK